MHGIFRNSLIFGLAVHIAEHRASKDQHIAVDDAANGTQQRTHFSPDEKKTGKITQK